MISETWLNEINHIQKICLGVGIPINVENDTNPMGIDGIIELGDIQVLRTGDVCESRFDMNIKLSIQKNKYNEIIIKMMMLSQALTDDNHTLFNGWAKEDNESLLIYNGNITVIGILNNDILK